MEALDDIASGLPIQPGNETGEAALWREFRGSGSDRARQKLFEFHYVFARQLAAKHYLDRKSGDMEFSDLCQLACTGLLEALDRYDPEKGTPFRSYARRRISGSILDGLAHMSELREQLSFRRRARQERVNSLAVQDTEKLDAAEAMQALIEMATGLAIGFMIEGSGIYVSQDEADKKMSPYESLAWRELTLSLRAAISSLQDQEEKVVSYHYIEGLSFEQIASAFGLSKGRISQIHRSALESLKSRLTPSDGFNLKR